MRVFVTGGSGFVGSAVIEELLAKGHHVNALVNQKPLPFGEHVKSIPGGLFDDAALDRGMSFCDAAIHIVGIIMEKGRATFERIHIEGTKAVVDAAKRNGIERYIHMSALGARRDAASDYHKTKFKAEEYVKASGLDWTIFRPSLIHGPKGEFMRMEAAWARGKAAPFLFMPYFGGGALGRGGAGNLQPVFIKDVARAFVEALSNPRTIREIHPLAGAQVVSWPDLHRISASAITGKRRRVMALPAWYARLLTTVLPRFMLPFNRDQVIMSQEENTADMGKFAHDFGWEPGRFEEQIREYAGQM